MSLHGRRQVAFSSESVTTLSGILSYNDLLYKNVSRRRDSYDRRK